MSDSLYHYSDNKFQLYKVIRRTNGIDNTAGERELKKEFPYYTGGFIYDCFITNTIEFARIMPHSCIYLKKNNTITTYKYPAEYKPFMNRVPGFTRSIDNNHLYMFENDVYGIKENITKNIDIYKKLSADKNCPYADFYKAMLEKLPEINEDTPPLVFTAEINE